MSTFRDTDELYGVLAALFTRLSQEDELASSLLEGELVLRFTYKEPAGSVTVDLREPPLTWTFGDSDLRPDVELIQTADIAHRFWLGRLSVPGAIALRQVVARGSVAKALSLLPALQPAFPLYHQVLAELGRQDLLPPSDEATSTWLQRTRAALGRMGRSRGRARARFSLSDVVLPPLPIPLRDDAAAAPPLRSPQDLPEGGAALDLAMLERMLLIREFEQELSRANAKGELPTEAIHLSIGQEATAVGVCFALRTDDLIATTHRGHGHMLAKGADLDGMMAEIHGKAEGLCGGKGGSMHVTDARVGAIGANGIVGASPLLAAGAAHSALLRGTDQVAVAFLGDGATNQGMFHEALNFAAVLDLPVVFVVENNLYGEFTPIERHTRVVRLSERATAYGMPGVSVDGNDVSAVHAATKQAVQRARSGEGPTLLECRTYRWHGHMEGEEVPYRTAAEVESWKARCPIEALAAKLDPEQVQALRRQTAQRVQQARAAAEQGSEPPLSALSEDVFAPDLRSLWTARPAAEATRQITCSQALWEALHEELLRDERVYLLGEDVTTGGYFAVTAGLVDGIGPQRVVDTPISEYAIVGSAVGAAMAGMRPVAEILFSDFLTTCMDPLVNQAAKLRLMSGGQYTIPLVVRTPGGAGLGMAAQHSQSLEALLTGVPGLVVVAPATPADAKGLLKSAIRSDNPVLFFENKLLYAATGPVPEGEHLVPLGVADVKRAGRDVTVVTVGAALSRALEAAEELHRDGVEIEVVDVRTLVPLDLATILASVAKTGRLVTVEDAPRTHGFGAEVVARVVDVAFGALRAAPRRVAAADVPLSYNSALENAALPDAAAVAHACRAVMGLG